MYLFISTVEHIYDYLSGCIWDFKSKILGNLYLPNMVIDTKFKLMLPRRCMKLFWHERFRASQCYCEDQIMLKWRLLSLSYYLEKSNVM